MPDAHSTDRTAFAPIVAVVLMGFALYCLWTGEISMRGGLVRRDESPIRYWFFVLTMIGLSTVSAVVALRALAGSQ